MKKDYDEDFTWETVYPTEWSKEKKISDILTCALDIYINDGYDGDFYAALDDTLDVMGLEISYHDYDSIITDMKNTIEFKETFSKLSEVKPIKDFVSLSLDIEIPEYEWCEQENAFETALFELDKYYEPNQKVTKKQIVAILREKGFEGSLSQKEIGYIANDVKKAVNSLAIEETPKKNKIKKKMPNKKNVSTKTSLEDMSMEDVEKRINEIKAELNHLEDFFNKKFEHSVFNELKTKVQETIDINDAWDDNCPDKEELNYEYLEFHTKDISKEWEFDLSEDQIEEVVLDLAWDNNVPTPKDCEKDVAMKLSIRYLCRLKEAEPHRKYKNRDIIDAMYHAECTMGIDLEDNILDHVRDNLNYNYDLDSDFDLREELDKKELVEKVKKLKKLTMNNLYKRPEHEDNNSGGDYDGVLI